MAFEHIPSELRALPQWLVWKYHVVDGLPTKIPYDAKTGKFASTTDSQTWSSFAQCAALISQVDGVGFVFTKDDPYCGIDLDKIMKQSEKIQEVHKNIYYAMDSYTEWSPSGEGMHIIVRATLPDGKNDRSRGCEIYSSDRFFTFTGNPCHNVVIANRQELAMTLWEELGGKEAESAFLQMATYEKPQQYEDGMIYEKANRANNAEKFIKLWNGQWKGVYPSQSEADFSLINILQFYTKNAEQIKRMFLLSGLGQRDKAKRNDYLTKMIARAFDRELPQIDFGPVPNENNHDVASHGTYAPISPIAPSCHIGNIGVSAVDQLRASPNLLPMEMATVPGPFTVPPGLMGDIARFVYEAAPRPVAEAAIAASIVFMAGIVGKAWNVSATGLNQYILFLAPTATGKEAIASGLSKLMHIVSQEMPAAADFQGPSNMASGPAFMKMLNRSRTGACMYSILPEVGLRMAAMAGERAAPAEKSLEREWLDCYSKSGHTQVHRGSVYSDKDNTVNPVPSPAFSMLGESVPSRFYANIDEQTILSGLIPRFTLIEYNGPRVPHNKYHFAAQPSRHIIESIKTICELALARIAHKSICEVKLDERVAELDEIFDKECDNKVNSNNREAMKYLWSRARLKALKLAATVAVGVNWINPTIDEAIYVWARDITVYEVSALCTKFMRGNLVSDIANLENEQLSAIIKYLYEVLNKDYVECRFNRTTARMHKDGMIAMTDISMRMSNASVFKKDKYKDHIVKMSRAIETIKSAGMFEELNMGSTDNAIKHGQINARVLKLADYDAVKSYMDSL